MPKVDEKTEKEKPKKSLKFNLDKNVTCEFLRTQTVHKLLPENDLDERRSLLKEEAKQKPIIKNKLTTYVQSEPCHPTADDPLSFIASKIRKPMIRKVN